MAEHMTGAEKQDYRAFVRGMYQLRQASARRTARGRWLK